MTTQPAGRRASGTPSLAVAIVTLLGFGCTTVRAPVSGIAPIAPVHGPAAEPQVELWLESGRDVTPEESALATAQAREALRQALQGRKLGEDDVLVVRAQAVSRTRSHRNDQRAAIAGMVVGAVAMVAVVVLALAGGKGSPRIGAPRLRGATRAGGAARPAAAPAVPIAGPVRAAAAAGPARPPASPQVPGGRGAPRAVPARTGSGGAGVEVDAGVLAYAPEPAPPDGAGEADRAGLLLAEAYAEPPAHGIAAERISAVTLPPPAPLEVERRGFFDGDWLRLELVVVDARSGAVRWAKAVTDAVDVRDAARLRETVDRALADEAGWYAPAPVVAY